MNEGISYVFTWYTNPDAKDLKCRSLNGRQWRDQDLYAPFLFDVEWGPVWDLNSDTSLAHPNCRCRLEVEVVVDVERLQIG